MGTLAIDIETASPFSEPPTGVNETEYFEWLAIAVGFRDGPDSEIVSEVLFRQGPWDQTHTADLFDQFFEWCDGRQIERALTYNGDWFDLKHLGNWAIQLNETGVRNDTYTQLRRLMSTHVDLAHAASEKHADELWDSQRILPLWKTCTLESVPEERVWYADYDLSEPHLSGLNIGDRHVKGEHVGRSLGEQYIDGLSAGIEDTLTHRELERLLDDYARGDVDVLFGLYDSLGGDRLDETYNFPFENAGHRR